jgi:thiol:disulfide interchange protein
MVLSSKVNTTTPSTTTTSTTHLQTYTPTQLSFEFESHALVLLVTYVPWCTYCKTMLTSCKKAAVTIESYQLQAKILILDLSLELHKYILEKYPIYGYPTILLFKYGVLVEGYSGPRNEK